MEGHEDEAAEALLVLVEVVNVLPVDFALEMRILVKWWIDERNGLIVRLIRTWKYRKKYLHLVEASESSSMMAATSGPKPEAEDNTWFLPRSFS